MTWGKPAFRRLVTGLTRAAAIWMHAHLNARCKAPPCEPSGIQRLAASVWVRMQTQTPLLRPHAPPRAHLVLISRWRLSCPALKAWALLHNTAAWPQWWPQLGRHLLNPICTVAITATRSERGVDGHCELEGRLRGCLPGQGLWVLEPVSRCEVDVTCRHEVVLHTPWMRALAPLLSALLARRHFATMQAGAQGMADRLACPSPRVSHWMAAPVEAWGQQPPSGLIGRRTRPGRWRSGPPHR
jgi:hypothetical protein